MIRVLRQSAAVNFVLLCGMRRAEARSPSLGQNAAVLGTPDAHFECRGVHPGVALQTFILAELVTWP